MKTTLNQRSFSKGEIAPDLGGRTDIAQYQAALKKARGVVFNKRGILYNAPGTETIMPGKYPTKATREIAFKFSFNQQFNLVFGDKYIHVIENGVPVFNTLANPTIESFPNGANPTLTIDCGSSSHPALTSLQIASGMLVQLQPLSTYFSQNIPIPSGDFSYFCLNRWFIIQNVSIGVSQTTFTLTDLYGNQIDSTTWGTYNDNLLLSVVYEIPTTYAYADLPLLKYAQSFDVIQLRHGSYSRMQLNRISNTNWTLTPNNAWPSQVQLCNDLAAGGGPMGGGYWYKFTTKDLNTGFESLPCPVIGISATATTTVTSGVGVGYVSVGGSLKPAIKLFLTSVTGFYAGSTVTFSQNIYDGSYPQITAGQTYTINGTGANYIIVYGHAIFPNADTLSVPAGTTAITTNAATSNQISSISNTNPIVIGTQAPHTMTNGQEVTIQGTGVFGLDGLTFNVTIQGSSSVSLNGVNGINYDLSPFTPGPSNIISPTAVTSAPPSLSSPITLTGQVLNPATYTSNIVFPIYASQEQNSGYGFIGYAVPAALGSTFTFIDQGIPPDPTLSPKSYIPLFLGPGNNPSSCNYYQQRLVELATDNQPQGMWTSVIGDYNDFTIHDPIQESDAIILDIASNELNQIFDSADSGFLILMTDMGPMIAAGDTTGQFTPSTNLIKRQMFAGASQTPRPLTIYKNVLYLEASQQSIRALEILVTPYYTYISQSDDITIFSEHLFNVSPVVEWDFKLYPDSQVFSVRKDGIMVVNTYLKEQEVNSFSWLDTLGSWLDVVAVQEGTETAVYPTVQRNSGPWIERFTSRYYTDPTIDAVFTHATDSYSGLINNGMTAVLSGTTVNFESVITATMSIFGASLFQVGWQVNFKYNTGTNDQQGNPIYWFARMIVTGTTSNTVVGTLMEAVNVGILGVTITDIRIATNVVGGLWHLNGQNVSVVADGWVQANPNDNSVPVITVTNGTITLPKSFGVINVGLPYLSDIQTLDLDEHQGQTFMDKKIAVKRVTLKLLNTGDVLVGPRFTENLPPTVFMDHPKLREMQGYDQTTGLFTGIIEVPMDAIFGYGGSFCIRNIQPLPMTILSIAPLIEVQA